MENHFTNLLALLFPPRFQKVESFQEECVVPNDIMAIPLTEDGVLWRAWDVRKTGIEKMLENK